MTKKQRLRSNSLWSSNPRQSFPGTNTLRRFAVFVLNDFLHIRTHWYLLFAAEDFFRLHSLVPCTTFGVKETEKVLRRLGPSAAAHRRVVGDAGGNHSRELFNSIHNVLKENR